MTEAVNVMDFVDARSDEILAAVKAIFSNSSISHRLAIPFHMRRRAASHNPKRIPSKFRPPVEGENKNKSHKKWKRKRNSKPVEGKAVRLSSHVWHAKRCHMRDLWGYRIALTTTQKGVRAAYRAMGTACNVIDTSYYCWSSLSSQHLHSKLSQHIKPNPPPCFDRIMASHIYDKDVNCLGPVRLLWINEQTVFIRIHPGIAQKYNLGDVFGDLGWRPYKDKLCQYTLCGTRSLELLTKSIKIDETMPEIVRNTWQNLVLHPFNYDLMCSTALGMKIVIPPSMMKSYKRLSELEIKQPEQRLTPCSEYQPEKLFCKIIEPHERGELEPINEISDKDKSTWFLIYRDPETSDCEVVFENLFGTRFWVELVYNGGRAIGMEDYHSLLTERKLLAFPHDYPDTTVGMDFMELLGGELREKENRRPPQKRINYEKLLVPHPFVPNFSELSQSPGFRIIRDSNLLVQLSLCRTPDVPLQYDQNFSFVSVVVTCGVRGVIQPRSPIYATKCDLNPIPRDITLGHLKDANIVGYVTSGHYAHSVGRSEGIGVMLLSALALKDSNASRTLFLTRKVTSTHFRKITVRVITP